MFGLYVNKKDIILHRKMVYMNITTIHMIKTIIYDIFV